MALGDAELRIFYRALGDPVSCDGVSTYPDTGEPVKAFVEEIGVDAVFEQARVSDSRYRMEIPWNAFPTAPKSGSVIQVLCGRLAGSYVARAVNPLEDGSIVEVQMRLA